VRGADDGHAGPEVALEMGGEEGGLRRGEGGDLRRRGPSSSSE
jgi:hypothetical protein